MYFLQECSKRCDYLLVGLHTDPTIDRPATKNKPIQSVFERWYQIDSMNLGADIIPYDTESDLKNMLAVLPIDVRFVGDDYAGKDVTGADICKTRGIEVVLVPRMHTWSSTELRKRLTK